MPETYGDLAKKEIREKNANALNGFNVALSSWKKKILELNESLRLGEASLIYDGKQEEGHLIIKEKACSAGKGRKLSKKAGGKRTT